MLDDSANWSEVHSSSCEHCASTGDDRHQHERRPVGIATSRPSSTGSSAAAGGNARRLAVPAPVAIDQNAITMGQLVIRSAQAQQQAEALARKNSNLESDLAKSLKMNQDLALDVESLTKTLEVKERQRIELEDANRNLQQRLKQALLLSEDAGRKHDLELETLKTTLRERSDFASFVHAYVEGVVPLFNEALLFSVAARANEMFRHVSSTTVGTIEDGMSALSVAQTNAVSEIIRQHERELKHKDDELESILRRERAQYQLSLQSYESQIADLDRKLCNQSAMIAQQRRHEAVLRGVLPPNQQDSYTNSTAAAALTCAASTRSPSPGRKVTSSATTAIAVASPSRLPERILPEAEIPAPVRPSVIPVPKDVVQDLPPAEVTDRRYVHFGGAPTEDREQSPPAPLQPYTRRSPEREAHQQQQQQQPQYEQVVRPSSSSSPIGTAAVVEVSHTSAPAWTAQHSHSYPQPQQTAQPGGYYTRMATPTRVVNQNQAATATADMTCTNSLYVSPTMDEVDRGLAACLRELSRSARR